ncbi:MAG: LacI family DNA-binding transcriptional regulator [Atopobiaceae bacterium]|nr:LacI family DNA-binding transcriptional regulator [Atopobiaceae bacterium]
MDINDIAQKAGVSRATVSRFLNNGYVSQEKRDLIQRIIDETGFVPSRRARQLRTGKTNLVAIIIPKINSQSVSRMVAGITEVLSANEYQALLADTSGNEHAELDYLRLFSNQQQVDGIILLATVFTPEHKSAIDKLRIPLVVLGQHLEGHTSVYHNDYGAIHDVTARLLPKARAIAYLGVREEDEAAGALRHRGFIDACAEAGVCVPEEAQQQVEFSSDAGFFGAEQFLDAFPDLDTIVCATDDIAFGAMMCAREYGKRVPDDIQISGLGDSMLSQIIHPSLTTVHLSYKTGGRRAAELLLERMANRTAPVTEVKLGHMVFIRNSTR